MGWDIEEFEIVELEDKLDMEAEKEKNLTKHLLLAIILSFQNIGGLGY